MILASLLHHYSGERAGLEEIEIQRMRERWSAVYADDPFYNPNMSLQHAYYWHLAFPPRIAKLFGNKRGITELITDKAYHSCAG